MLFNSITFAIFLPLVFALYWGMKGSMRTQNLFLLLASYVFYGWWDWRFLSLIFVSSAVDYSVGLAFPSARTQGRRRLLLATSVATNLGLLGFFKYFNFFAESLAAAVQGLFGYPLSTVTLNVVLPVGISFYTFQTLSYSIDIYRGKLEPVRDPVAFFAFVSFFPQLVAGPIERASNLLPQFTQPRHFDLEKASDGMRQILWGLFKKIVVADTCGVLADQAFSRPGDLPGSGLLLGTFYFAVQIYGDFSGYSDIAIGTGRLFGFSLMRNFAYPYFSRDIAEFWRRWHISLSSWFRDYVYIPLGGSRVPKPTAILNILIVFSVSGLWHGANWTFLIWGILNAIFFLPLFMGGDNRRFLGPVAPGRVLPGVREAFQIGVTFTLTCLAWIFFRADSVGAALHYLAGIFSSSLFSVPNIRWMALFNVSLLACVEWVQREKEHGLAIENIHPVARQLIYLFLVTLVLQNFGAEQEFIYFQF